MGAGFVETLAPSATEPRVVALRAAAATRESRQKARTKMSNRTMSHRSVALDRKVPSFSLPATGARTWKLADAAGKKLVVYFYPRDNTPGCTREGEGFRDLYPAFKRAGTVVVGISPDSVKSHEKFREAFSFPFELLSDEERKVCELFDVYKEKSLYGRKYMGVERMTLLIDREGVVRKIYPKVSVTGHADAVLEVERCLHELVDRRLLRKGHEHHLAAVVVGHGRGAGDQESEGRD